MRYKVTAIETHAYGHIAKNGREAFMEGVVFRMVAVDKRMTGRKYVSVYISARNLNKTYVPLVGDYVYVHYNRMGNPCYMTKAPKKQRKNMK